MVADSWEPFADSCGHRSSCACLAEILRSDGVGTASCRRYLSCCRASSWRNAEGIHKYVIKELKNIRENLIFSISKD